MKTLVINGPNINLLGIREKGIYGNNTYSDLVSLLEETGKRLGIEVIVVQSNSEGEIIDFIQGAYGKFEAIVINPGAYTHYSYAILDALKGVALPTIEVHISNIHKREEFRRKSVTAEGCIGQISGLGFLGYKMALEALKEIIEGKE